MIYLNEKNLLETGLDWKKVIDVLEASVKCLSQGDFAQPVKPYLRYRDLTNRIIAMPAFVGGDFDMAGIKWIASFPGNIHKGIPRAHSVVILNESATGKPVGIISTALLSIIRTAGVSGLMIRAYEKFRPLDKVHVGITGWGPIGQYHLKMAAAVLGDRITKVSLYDLRPIDPSTIDFFDPGKITVTNSWAEAYNDADVFMTCTVSKAPYIDLPPKKASLQLNVSLRDYKTDVFDYVKDAIIVDDWEEVCREKTDIEMMHLVKGLQKENTRSIIDAVVNDCIKNYRKEQPVMFNPMGMAVFDIAVGAYYLKEARQKGIGQELD